MSYRAISLFSGCGGLDLGFHQQGVDILTAVDNDPAAIECFNQNFGSGGVCLSVEDPFFRKLIEGLEKVDIVLGGFPCQGFSKSGPKKKDDPRNRLYLSMLYAVGKLEPSVFVAENVDGIEQNYNGEYVKKIIEDFVDLGYTVDYKVINAAEFGVPQHRRRIFFIGHKFGSAFKWPKPTHYAEPRNGEFKSRNLLTADLPLFRTNTLLPARTMYDAISQLVHDGNSVPDNVTVDKISQKDQSIISHIGKGQKLCNVRFADTSVYTWQIPEVFGETTDREKIILETIARNRRKKMYGVIPNGNPLSLDDIKLLTGLPIVEDELIKLEQQGYLKRIDTRFDLKGAMFCSGLYKRPSWNEPSPTIITLFHNPRYFIHPTENRPFTIRECARLQSFPDDFLFLAAGISIEDSYRLIGNAVPPRLASHIAQSVLAFIDSHQPNEIKNTQQEYEYVATGVRFLDNSLS